MAAIDVLRTLTGWAASAFSALFGGVGDVLKAITAVWHYVTSLHNVVGWLFSNPVIRYAVAVLSGLGGLLELGRQLAGAMRRFPGWVWLRLVEPTAALLQRHISTLQAWTALQLGLLHALVVALYLRALAYAHRLVTAEHTAMVRAVAAEHAAMLKAVAAAVALVQRQAAGGYNAGRRQRMGVVATILNDLADRQPVLKAITGDLAGIIVDLAEVDNPLLRIFAGKLLQEIIAHLGVDKVTGDLLGRLLDPITGGGRPGNLYQVARDAESRLTALEAQWADFARHGGPEVEQAGDQWKLIASLGADAALLAFTGLAIADPARWAAGVNDTIARPANDALARFYDLLKRA